MVSHNLSKILSSPFVVIDDKGGEKFPKILQKGGKTKIDKIGRDILKEVDQLKFEAHM